MLDKRQMLSEYAAGEARAGPFFRQIRVGRNRGRLGPMPDDAPERRLRTIWVGQIVSTVGSVVSSFSISYAVFTATHSVAQMVLLQVLVF